MKYLIIILKKELKELSRQRAVLIFAFVTGLAMLFFPLYYLNKALKTGEIDNYFLVNFMDYFISFYSLFIILFISNITISRLFYEEKARNTIESLLATPVTPRIIWLAKSITILLITYCLSILISILFIIIYNFHFEFSNFLIPSIKSIFICIVINPIIGFFIISLFGFFQLITNDVRVGNFILFSIFFIFFYYLNPLEMLIPLNLFIFYFFASIILLCIPLIASKLINSERIVLTMKG